MLPFAATMTEDSAHYQEKNSTSGKTTNVTTKQTVKNIETHNTDLSQVRITIFFHTVKQFYRNQ